MAHSSNTSPATQATSPWSETDRRIASAVGPEPPAAMPTAQGKQQAKKPATQPLAPKSPNVQRRLSASQDGVITIGELDARIKRQAKEIEEEERANPPKKRKTGNNAKTSDKKAADALLDVSAITLPGEATGGKIPVYETCDSIRRQIRAILKKPGMTQAGFCRALGKFGAMPEGTAPSANQLARFLDKKGPMKGNTNVPFRASYVLFEKMRIRDGKDKSKFRKEMEEKHKKSGGVDTVRSTDLPITLHVSERAGYDRWGCFHIETKPSFR